MELSNRQRQVHDFISWYNENKGMCPSIADVAEGLKLSNTTVSVYIDTLKKKGCVTNEYGIPRSLKAVPA